MTQCLAGISVIDKLVVDFEILDSFRMIGAKMPPIYQVYFVKLRVLDKEMENIEVPSGDQWKPIENFGKMKYRLHQ